MGDEVTGVEARPFALPAGTVTFLVSGVEGAARLWEEAAEAMTVASLRYHELLEAAIDRHGAIHPLERGQGESVAAVFSRASDAVAAAVGAQQLFAAEAWPTGAALAVRMALHTGEARLRDDGYHLGPALDRCVRLRDSGHGGQIVLSATTAALVADRLPPLVEQLDLGVHRFKDLGRPEHVWQLVGPDLDRGFPPLRSLDAFRHNLPTQLTPLIGRAQDTSSVRQLFEDARLVTLTGSAGVGKTRLALAVAADLVDQCPAGVWWVELAALSDLQAVGLSVLHAIGGRDSPGQTPAQQVGAELGPEVALVVLDNCEHLVAACAEFVAELLAVNPAVLVLTTSREPLAIPGETTWPVPSLDCPQPDRSVEVAALSQYDAVLLFIDRARRARPSFKMTDTNAAAIAQICYRLDGIPLALELAAARSRQLSAERIAAELDDRFRLLTGGARTVMVRQQTLAASIDWSHDRLDDDERIAFRRLGAFSGVFPLEAAEAVVSTPAGGIEADQVFDLVNRLVDKSLVAASEGIDGEPRYRLLESLRAYAINRARTAGELSALRDAHLSWWTRWLAPTFTMPTDHMLDQVEEFHDNLKTALDWSTNDPPRGLQLLKPLARVSIQLRWSSDATPATDLLLSSDNAEQYPTAWLAAANECVALGMAARGPQEVSSLVDRIEAVAAKVGDDYHLAVARLHRGGIEEAQKVRDLARDGGDHFLAASASIFMALCSAEDDPAAAEAQLAESASIARNSGNSHLREEILVVQAMAARCTGDLRQSIELGWSVLNNRGTSRVADIVGPMTFAALLARDHGALQVAAARAEHEKRKQPGTTPLAEQAAHRLALLEGAPSRVDPELRGQVSVLLPTFGTLWLECREAIDAGQPHLALAGARALHRPVPHGHAVLAAVEAAATSDENRWHDALSLALSHRLRLIAVDALEGLAVAASRQESWSESRRLLIAAERLRAETAYCWRFNFEQHAVDEARGAAYEALGEDAARMADTEGASLDWREAADYARRARGERKRPRHGWASLTPTELQVAVLVAEGLNNPLIAERLFMSRSTVKTHLEHIFAKLGIRSRAELAAEASRH